MLDGFIFDKFLIAQMIGIVTTVIAVVSAQMKKMGHILACELACNLLSASTYILLGGDSGAYVCFVATVQAIVSCLYSLKKKKIPNTVTGIFIVIYVGITIYTYKQPIDVVAGACAVAFALSIVQEKAAKYRFFMFINSTLWLFYDLYVGAYTMMITHGMLFVSLVTAMFRHDRKKEKV